MLPQEKFNYTLDEYLEIDHYREEKIEFWDGHVFLLAGATQKHDRIQFNCALALGNELRGKPCRVFLSDMRVDVPDYPPYRYHDLSALYGEAVFKNLGKQQLLKNPSVIFEIPSESTADFDRGYKFTNYKSIPGFTEYILIAQDRPHVSQFVKQTENAGINHEFNSLEEKFLIESLDSEIALTEIYENVEFPPIQNHLRIIE